MVGWVSGTYWRFINFSATHLGPLYILYDQLEWLIFWQLLWGDYATPNSFLRCCRSCYLVTWLTLKLLLGWLVDQHLSKTSFHHIEQWFAVNCLSVHGLFAQFFSHIATAKLDSENWCYSLAFWRKDHELQRNWTWTPFTRLASKWYFHSSKLTGVSSDGVTPGSSRDTLMGLDCIHWILQQNLRIQRQAPEQKLCHKARWFYGIVTSSSVTYLEPSIAARSFCASFNIIE